MFIRRYKRSSLNTWRKSKIMVINSNNKWPMTMEMRLSWQLKMCVRPVMSFLRMVFKWLRQRGEWHLQATMRSGWFAISFTNSDSSSSRCNLSDYKLIPINWRPLLCSSTRKARLMTMIIKIRMIQMKTKRKANSWHRVMDSDTKRWPWKILLVTKRWWWHTWMQQLQEDSTPKTTMKRMKRKNIERPKY
jgi:hypothetical protein